MIRVLVTDDSDTARGLLVGILSSDPDITVVGQARSGAEAVKLAEKLRPNVITMDIQMAGMDGFEATEAIMSSTPTPIVIVSAIAPGEVGVAMKALRAGALTVLAKPHGPGSPGFESSCKELLWNVKAMADVKVVGRRAPAKRPVFAAPAPQVVQAGVKLVAIATSTGGPPALATVLSALPAGFRVPILIVQHIADGFTPGLVAWLGSVSPLRVKVAEHGEPLKGGVAYVAPDGQHLGVSRRLTVDLSQGPPIGGFRPAGTALFESAAKACGPTVIGVIMTGMGDDGVAGLRWLHQAGGHVIAQNKDTSVVFGMPAAAIAAGVVHDTLPLSLIPPRLVDLVQER